MAGQEIEGGFWDQSLARSGLDLLPTIVCTGFRILGLSNKMIQVSFCVDPTPKSSSPHAKQGDTLGHFRDVFIH
jgi:hypothetical protein